MQYELLRSKIKKIIVTIIKEKKTRSKLEKIDKWMKFNVNETSKLLRNLHTAINPTSSSNLKKEKVQNLKEVHHYIKNP